MPPRRLPSNYYLVAVPLKPLLLAMKVTCGKPAAYHRFPCIILRRTLLSLRDADTSCFPRSTSSASTVNSCQLRLPPRDQPPAHLQTVIFQDLSFWTANTLRLACSSCNSSLRTCSNSRPTQSAFFANRHLLAVLSPLLQLLALLSPAHQRTPQRKKRGYSPRTRLLTSRTRVLFEFA